MEKDQEVLKEARLESSKESEKKSNEDGSLWLKVESYYPWKQSRTIWEGKESSNYLPAIALLV
jgi:hypothetical protein